LGAFFACLAIVWGFMYNLPDSDQLPICQWIAFPCAVVVIYLFFVRVFFVLVPPPKVVKVYHAVCIFVFVLWFTAPLDSWAGNGGNSTAVFPAKNVSGPENCSNSTADCLAVAVWKPSLSSTPDPSPSSTPDPSPSRTPVPSLQYDVVLLSTSLQKVDPAELSPPSNSWTTTTIQKKRQIGLHDAYVVDVQRIQEACMEGSPRELTVSDKVPDRLHAASEAIAKGYISERQRKALHDFLSDLYCDLDSSSDTNPDEKFEPFFRQLGERVEVSPPMPDDCVIAIYFK